MKSIWTTVGMLGLGLLLLAASASDAGEISFVFILLLVLFGVGLLLASAIGMRARKAVPPKAVIREVPVRYSLHCRGNALGRNDMQEAYLPDVVG